MTGDVIYVFGEMDEDGFYMGQLAGTGARGLVPSNFLAEATPDPLTASQQAAQTAQHMMQQQHVSYHQQIQQHLQQQQLQLQQNPSVIFANSNIFNPLARSYQLPVPTTGTGGGAIS